MARMAMAWKLALGLGLSLILPSAWAQESTTTPPVARDPHDWSGGYTLDPARPLRMADEHRFHALMVDRLEWVTADGDSATAWDFEAWYGRDYDRFVLEAEGMAEHGSLEEAGTELLWRHAVRAYWDTQLGVRYDSGVHPGEGWLAFGLRGLAPYWFELEMMAYLGDAGRSALRLKAEYELLFTQRWILEPHVEADFYGHSDPVRGRGTGLTEIHAGLRLRYEFRREFAPYAGITWTGLFGGTADAASAAGEDTGTTAFVLGLRFWW